MPIEVTPEPIVRLLIFVHLRKAEAPIEVTEFGIVTEIKPVHPLKAEPPMLVTVYVTPLYATDEGILITPEYEIYEVVLYVTAISLVV